MLGWTEGTVAGWAVMSLATEVRQAETRASATTEASQPVARYGRARTPPPSLEERLERPPFLELLEGEEEQGEEHVEVQRHLGAR